MQILSTPFGEHCLQRLPLQNNEPNRAWDAADEYLLSALADQPPNQDNTILLVNDQFGALSISLNDYPITNWGDSFISKKAITHNFKLNELPPSPTYISSTSGLTQTFDTVLIKIPKTLSLLEQQLIDLRKHIHTDTTIIAGGMVKHIHTSTLELFEKIIGTTTTSLARKKARLIFTKLENKADISSPYPTSFLDDELNLELINHANVFSRKSLDIGARFMIEQFNQLLDASSIIDLGCGNGVLGIMAKRQQPAATLHFVDESYMAIASAKENYQNAIENNDANFYVSDSLSDTPNLHADLILCNPPFHQNHAVGDQTAWRMLKQSHQQLVNNGKLWVIGNRNLGYHIKLKRLFGNCTTMGSNKKFVVLSATKTA